MAYGATSVRGAVVAHYPVALLTHLVEVESYGALETSCKFAVFDGGSFPKPDSLYHVVVRWSSVGNLI